MSTLDALQAASDLSGQALEALISAGAADPVQHLRSACSAQAKASRIIASAITHEERRRGRDDGPAAGKAPPKPDKQAAKRAEVEAELAARKAAAEARGK